MTPTQLKAVNTIAATVFGLTGVACFALAAFLAFKPAPPKEAQYVKRTPDVAHCMQALKDLGMTVEKTGPHLVRAQVPQSVVDQNPKAVLDVASIGIAACKLPLKAFCMGTECGTEAGKPNPLGPSGDDLVAGYNGPLQGA
jgi:hypothetical protein